MIDLRLERALRDYLGLLAHGYPVPVQQRQELRRRMLETASLAGVDALLGAIDHALSDLFATIDTVDVAVTGLGWLGAGAPAVERILTELLRSARHEIVATAFSLTPGSGRIMEVVEEALRQGVRCTLVVNDLDHQPPATVRLLRRLASTYPGRFLAYEFKGTSAEDTLHAKAVVADRRKALVGSANLSHRGLVMSHELAVVVTGPSAARIADRVQLLLSSRMVSRLA